MRTAKAASLGQKREEEMRNALVVVVVALGVVVLMGSKAFAASSANQTVNFGINGFQEISVAGAPSLIIDTTVAGENPTSVSDASSTYSFTTNKANRKITGVINTAMPEGLTLSVAMAAPGSTWTSAGEKNLGIVAVDLASGNKGLAKDKTLTYTLYATPNAEEVSGSKIVTYTLTVNA